MTLEEQLRALASDVQKMSFRLWGFPEDKKPGGDIGDIIRRLDEIVTRKMEWRNALIAVVVSSFGGAFAILIGAMALGVVHR